MRDSSKPNVICPECGHTKVFFHCALQNNEGDIYDWGKVVTCLKCKTLFAVGEQGETQDETI